MKVTLAAVGFLAGAAAGLESAITGIFCVAEVEVVEGADDVLPVVIVMATGAELTRTGSVDGMGLPSLVCNFTTWKRKLSIHSNRSNRSQKIYFSK